MQLERRALYNSLRLNWLSDPTLKVESWQVEDYRTLNFELLFERLEKFQIHLDKQTFQLYAENVDSPEDLTDELLLDTYLENENQDEVYLLVFELWRRLVTDKKSLSIFLDELDHQIYLYDTGQSKSSEAVQDALEELAIILDENIDSGVDPVSIFETMSASCANDLESFLYDYTSEQIENENYIYSSELLDNFSDYVPEAKWFEFLRIRIQAVHDTIGANQAIRKLIHEYSKEEDLEFNLEILSFIAKSGEYDIFINLLKKSIPLLEIEDDFFDLVTLSIEYFERLDLDMKKQQLETLLKSRFKINPEAKFKTDAQVAEFIKICEHL